MKRITASLSALLILSALFTLTSCNKEETSNGHQFRATMEDCSSQNGKTTLSGTNLNWVGGDRIAVYGTAGRGIYSATPQTPATTAIFDNVSGETGNAPFRAFYPASLTTDGVNITLPATQATQYGLLTNFPMYTESATSQLSFRNLCGVLKLHLTKANTNISAINITAASEINGVFSIDYNNGNPELTYVSGGTNTTTLTCSTAQGIANGCDFYIYLPEGHYSGLQIRIFASDGCYCTKTSNRTINITRSRYTLITLGENDLSFSFPEGSLPGLFSVSDTQQVRFSQGNLEYQPSSSTWRFGANQLANGNWYTGDDPYSVDWISVFGWGTGNNPTLSSNDLSDYTEFVDWGTNAISNGGNEPNLWRTLSRSEMIYLFFTRTNSTNLSTPNARFINGRVSGINGRILFPNGYNHPASVPEPDGINSYNYSFSENTYTQSQWAEMEQEGAVFLQSWYYVLIVPGYTDADVEDNPGYLWTSDGYPFSPSGTLFWPSYPKTYKLSVRLVQNANHNL